MPSTLLEATEGVNYIIRIRGKKKLDFQLRIQESADMSRDENIRRYHHHHRVTAEGGSFDLQIEGCPGALLDDHLRRCHHHPYVTVSSVSYRLVSRGILVWNDVVRAAASRHRRL